MNGSLFLRVICLFFPPLWLDVISLVCIVDVIIIFFFWYVSVGGGSVTRLNYVFFSIEN